MMDAWTAVAVRWGSRGGGREDARTGTAAAAAPAAAVAAAAAAHAHAHGCPIRMLNSKPKISLS